jgi:hypothetical protein
MHHTMQRPKIDMDEGMFRRSLAVAVELQQRHGRQREINLAGIGESTMHPRLADYMGMCREAMPWASICLATNGVDVTADLVEAIKPYAPRVFVSLHRPEKAGPAVELFRRAGLLAGVSADPSVSAVDWAGQVKWHVSADRVPCQWLHEGHAIIHADGHCARCPFDGNRTAELCDTPEGLLTAQHGRMSLCDACHMGQ